MYRKRIRGACETRQTVKVHCRHGQTCTSRIRDYVGIIIL